MSALVEPQITVPTANRAITLTNKWLHREVGMAVHVVKATFDPVSFYWHLPVELAYPSHGTLGVVGDIYLHAVSGTFAGCPNPKEFQERAEALAKFYGIE